MMRFVSHSFTRTFLINTRHLLPPNPKPPPLYRRVCRTTLDNANVDRKHTTFVTKDRPLPSLPPAVDPPRDAQKQGYFFSSFPNHVDNHPATVHPHRRQSTHLQHAWLALPELHQSASARRAMQVYCDPIPEKDISRNGRAGKGSPGKARGCRRLGARARAPRPVGVAGLEAVGLRRAIDGACTCTEAPALKQTFGLRK